MTLKAAAITGEALDMKELPATQTRDWVTACPPGSPALTNGYTFQRMRNPSYMTTELLWTRPNTLRCYGNMASLWLTIRSPDPRSTLLV